MLHFKCDPEKLLWQKKYFHYIPISTFNLECSDVPQTLKQKHLPKSQQKRKQFFLTLVEMYLKWHLNTYSFSQPFVFFCQIVRTQFYYLFLSKKKSFSCISVVQNLINKTNYNN